MLTGDRSKSAKDKSVIKTKLTPIAPNDPVKILNKSKSKTKSNHGKNITLDDIFDNIGVDDDDDEIQGDASGITIPISKSLGKNLLKYSVIDDVLKEKIKIRFYPKYSQFQRQQGNHDDQRLRS